MSGGAGRAVGSRPVYGAASPYCPEVSDALLQQILVAVGHLEDGRLADLEARLPLEQVLYYTYFKFDKLFHLI